MSAFCNPTKVSVWKGEVVEGGMEVRGVGQVRKGCREGGKEGGQGDCMRSAGTGIIIDHNFAH